MKRFGAMALAGLLACAPAHAAITLDGIADTDYGAPTAVINYQAGSPTSNFGSPSATTAGTGYSIYLYSDADFVYGLLKATGPVPSFDFFANLYFDVDPGNGTAADVVYEILNQRGTIGAGYFAAPIEFFTSADAIEFKMPDYYLGNAFGPNADGTQVYLRMSQSYGLSVAGGSSFGPNSLGAITIGGAPVPEPGTWAMMIGGFGLMGGLMRRRRKDAGTLATA